jgi:Tfp pilus assembly protein PilN
VTTQVAVGLSGLPRVNLLPAEIAEARRLRRIGAGLAASVLVACAGVGGLWMHEHAAVRSAQNALAQANARNVALQGQTSQYQNVTAVKAQLQNQQAMLSTALGNEVLWSHYLADLSEAMPGNVWFDQLQLQLNDGSAATTPTATTPPATTPGASTPTSTAIGSVHLTGSALSHNDLATLLVALAGERGLANSYFTKSAEQSVTNTTKTTDEFDVTADVTPDALCGARCTDPQAGE